MDTLIKIKINNQGMSTKSKGTNAERELIKMFWEAGWAAFRAAGSGSARHACPDIIVGNAIRRMGIECKASKTPYQYFKKKEIEELLLFCKTFGAEAWTAVKFDSLGWFFMSLDDLRETEDGFSVSEIDARNKGLLFEEITK